MLHRTRNLKYSEEVNLSVLYMMWIFTYTPCAMVYHHYTTNTSVHATRNVAAYRAVFRTRWCTYRSTWCPSHSVYEYKAGLLITCVSSCINWLYFLRNCLYYLLDRGLSWVQRQFGYGGRGDGTCPCSESAVRSPIDRGIVVIVLTAQMYSSFQLPSKCMHRISLIYKTRTFLSALLHCNTKICSLFHYPNSVII